MRIATVHARRIRSGNNTKTNLDRAENESTQKAVVPLLAIQSLEEGTLVFGYDDQSILLIKIDDNRNVIEVSVPASNTLFQNIARNILEGSVKGLTKEQHATFHRALKIADRLRGKAQDAMAYMANTPSPESEEALSHLARLMETALQTWMEYHDDAMQAWLEEYHNTTR